MLQLKIVFIIDLILKFKQAKADKYYVYKDTKIRQNQLNLAKHRPENIWYLCLKKILC